MKILLLNPPYEKTIIREGRCQQLSGPFNTTYPPLTLATLSSILESKHKTTIIDCIAENISHDALLEIIRKNDFDIIIASISTPSFDSDIKYLKALKKTSNAKVYVFGVHAKYISEKNISGIELIKIEPEKFAYKLIGKKYSFDRLPAPNWNTINLNKYRFPLTNQKYTILQPTRGCPNNCLFCVAPFYYGNKTRKKSIESIKEELRIAQESDASFIIILSEDIASNNEYFNELCNEMKNSSIKWECSIKVSDITKEKIDTLAKSGCVILSMGIESKDAASMKGLSKHVDLRHTEKIIEYCNNKNILTIGHFILGLKNENKNKSMKTINLAKNIGVDYALFYNLVPFPGSPLYEKEKYNLTNIPWNKFEYSNSLLSDNNNVNQAYRVFYLNSIIKRLYKTIKVLGLKSIPALITHSLWFIRNLFKRN